MNWNIDCIPDQRDRIIFITGANSGLGFETAIALLKKGATVIIGCRSEDKAEKAKQELLERTKLGKVDLLKIDLADLEEVNQVANKLSLKYKKLDLLINNAGVMAPPKTYSKQGFELQFAVNHLSHMAITLKLLPLLTNGSRARVVTVSSGAQFLGKINWDDLQGERNYDRWAAYSQSKLANVMFALELDFRLKRLNIAVASLSAHPGLARTNLQTASLKANGSWPEAMAYKFMAPIFQSAFMGSLPQLFAATDVNAQSGQQYGPRFNFRGTPKICSVAGPALNNEQRGRLWKESEKLIGNFVDIRRGKELLLLNP